MDFCSAMDGYSDYKSRLKIYECYYMAMATDGRGCNWTDGVTTDCVSGRQPIMHLSRVWVSCFSSTTAT